MAIHGVERKLIDLELGFLKNGQVCSKKVADVLEDEDIVNVDHRAVIFSLQFMQQPDLLFDYINSRIENDKAIAIYALLVLSPSYVNDPRMIDIFERLGFLQYWQEYSINDICIQKSNGWRCNSYRLQLSPNEALALFK